MASLRIVQGPAAGTLLDLGGEQAVLGRSPDCDLVLDSLAVSRRHARVSRRGDQFALDDVGSSAGTYLNDHQIRGPLWLASGDRIQLGPYHIALEAPAPEPLTVAEWLAGTDPRRLLGGLGGRGLSERKLLLFAVACCRRLPPGWDWAEFAEAIELAGRCAEGEVRREYLHAQCGRDYPPCRPDAWEAASASAGLAVQLACGDTAGLSVGELLGRLDAAGGMPCGLLRDVAGNPFRGGPRSGPAQQCWGDGTVVSLARAAYEGRPPGAELDAGLLGVLADALTDAGSTDETTLSHLRGPGPHIRGCWALDAILGRE